MNIAACNSVVPFNVSKIIQQKGYKQGIVAARAGLNDHQLTDILKGRRLLKVLDIVALSEALGVDVGDLFAPTCRPDTQSAQRPPA